MIGTLKGTIVTPLMVANETLIVHTGLGIFRQRRNDATFTGRVLAGVDIFTVWQAVVTAIPIGIGAALGGLGPLTSQT